MVMKLLVISSAVATAFAARFNEVWTREKENAEGIKLEGGDFTEARVMVEDVPDALDWCNKDGVSYCTMNRNQHLPQYCGACWAHGAVSALGDRIKIARKGKGIDINLSVQHILNCADVGSCHGGSVAGTYQWLHSISRRTGTGIAYESSNPYLACSSESSEGACEHSDWSCTPKNIAATCSTFSENGGSCKGLDHYPNATIARYGTIRGAEKMKEEIASHGPISCGIDAVPMLNYTGSNYDESGAYTGGIISFPGSQTDHVVSVVGYGRDEKANKDYWIVRNSWGEFWGTMGFVKVERGHNAMQLEGQCTFADLGSFTGDANSNYPCFEGGENC